MPTAKKGIKFYHALKYNTVYLSRYCLEQELDKLEKLINHSLKIKKPKVKQDDETIKEILSVLPQIDFKNL